MKDEDAFVRQDAIRLLDLLVELQQTIAPGEHEDYLKHERIELSCSLQLPVETVLSVFNSLVVLDCNHNDASERQHVNLVQAR